MPMPNRHTTDNNYRYAFQGQEKDGETGMEAFELRLWDGRIGRWLTIDPYRQFDSPYLGMGNNPVSVIDPDGGFACIDAEGNSFPCPEGYTSYDSIVSQLDAYFDRDGTFIGTGIHLNEVLVNHTNANINFNLDLTFNVIGTIGDAGEMFDFGRYYIEDNKFLNLNLPSKYLGAAGDVYDIGSGVYKLYNSNTDAEIKSNFSSFGLDVAVIGVSRRHPVVGVVYGTLKIIRDSDTYSKALHKATREAYYKKYGSYPDGVNHTATLRQSSGMYRECATCPLKFR